MFPPPLALAVNWQLNEMACPATQEAVEEVEVVVPDGWHDGEELIVTAPSDGAELVVVVPDGLKPGDHMVVTLPTSAAAGAAAAKQEQQAELLVVTVPLGTQGGQEMLIEAADGRQLIVQIPLGLLPGDTMEVSIPRPRAGALSPTSSAQRAQSPPETPSARRFSPVAPALPSSSSASAKSGQPSSGPVVAEPPPTLPAAPAQQRRPLPSVRAPAPVLTLPPARALPPPLPPAPPPPPPPPPATSSPSRAAYADRLLAPELSDESDADDEDEAAKARFGVGSPVEVMRSDGLFTLATIVDYDAGGRTYTIRVSDGRLKHFVDEDELRVPRFLLLSTGEI